MAKSWQKVAFTDQQKARAPEERELVDLVQDAEASIRATRIWIETAADGMVSRWKSLEHKEEALRELAAELESGDAPYRWSAYAKILEEAAHDVAHIAHDIESAHLRFKEQAALLEEQKTNAMLGAGMPTHKSHK